MNQHGESSWKLPAEPIHFVVPIDFANTVLKTALEVCWCFEPWLRRCTLVLQILQPSNGCFMQQHVRYVSRLCPWSQLRICPSPTPSGRLGAPGRDFWTQGDPPRFRFTGGLGAPERDFWTQGDPPVNLNYFMG